MDTPTIKTGFLLDAIKQEVEWQEWNEDWQNEGMEARGVFLGTVFTLLPSGKYYTPWAKGNVDPCPECNGNGELPKSAFHTPIYFGYNGIFAKRHDHAYTAIHFVRNRINSTIRSRKYATLTIKLLIALYQTEKRYAPTTCKTCGGLGSAEAYQDQLWYEQAEKELDSIGLTLESGEGDPCDLFAMDYRDKDI